MPRAISDRCREFLKHWESLRDGKVMPSLQDYLDHPSPDLQPNVMITDFVSRTEIPIRLFGTALEAIYIIEEPSREGGVARQVAFYDKGGKRIFGIFVNRLASGGEHDPATLVQFQAMNEYYKAQAGG